MGYLPHAAANPASIRQAAISQRPSSVVKFEVVIVNSLINPLVLVLRLRTIGQLSLPSLLIASKLTAFPRAGIDLP